MGTTLIVMKKIILLLTMFFPLVSSAQKLMTASGEYTYYAPLNITVDQAKSIAIERAKIKMIADNFGTIVGVSNTTTVSNVNGESSVSFLSIGESEVKGEWIETIGTPQVNVLYQDNMLVVSVKIKGTIRELKSARIQFEARVLRNGIEDKYEDDEYRDGDYMYLSFATPESGYVAVYLYDQQGVYRLLPLKNQKDGSQTVEAGNRYVFFANKRSQYSPELNRQVESVFSEYTMYCNNDNELNRIYVIFSPNRFSHPLDDISVAEDMPAELSFEAFQSWLSKSRRQDNEMYVKIKDITLRK